MAETSPLLEEDAEAAWELLVFGADERPPPMRGDAEDAAWFRAQLQELGFTQGSFARWTQRRGDDRSERGTRSRIQRMSAGQVRAPGEVRVLLGLMLRSKRRKMARAARERDERNAPWNDPPEERPNRGEPDARGAPEGHSSETRRRRGEPDALEAPGGDLSETRSDREELGAHEAHRNDSSEERRERAKPDALEAVEGHLSETRRGREERGGREAPQGHSSETRGERPPDGGTAQQ